jgi:mRNA-degrading endonuclease RelE of RelBE toxin-antitoxin system
VYRLAIKEKLDSKFKKLQKKDKEMLRLIERKVQDILEDPYRFKPLRKPLQNKRRVHTFQDIKVLQVNQIDQYCQR